MAWNRHLIINADDFGEAPWNPCIVEGLGSGALTSATLLVGRTGSADAAAFARESGAAVGLHLNLTAGPPVSDPAAIPTLVGSDGHFLGKSVLEAQLNEAIAPEDIAVECQAQLDRFENWVGPPSHVDGHHHVHVRPAVAVVVAPLLAARGIRCIRMPIEPDAFFAHLEPEQRLWATTLIEGARTSAQIYAQHRCRWPMFMGMGYGGEACTLDRLQERLADLPEGVTEYMVHVVREGDVDETHPGFVRRIEWVVLRSDAFRQILDDAGVTLVTYRDV